MTVLGIDHENCPSSRRGAVVAHLAHNQEVAGSNPAGAIMDYKELRSRRVGIRITPKTILDLVRRHCELVDGKFPKDVQYDAVHYDFDTNSFSIKLVSETFDKVEEGHAMPYIDLKLRPKIRREQPK